MREILQSFRGKYCFRDEKRQRSERRSNFSSRRASIAAFSDSDISSAAEAKARKKEQGSQAAAIESMCVQFFLRAASIFMCTPVSLSGPTIYVSRCRQRQLLVGLSRRSAQTIKDQIACNIHQLTETCQHLVVRQRGRPIPLTTCSHGLVGSTPNRHKRYRCRLGSVL